MKRMLLAACLAVLAAAMPALGTAWAQTADGTPGRIGNVWDGVRHQPTRGEVRGAETGAGDAQDRQRKAAEDRELAAIQRRLMAPPAH